MLSMAGIPTKYLIAAIIWAIIGVIGILIMIIASSPPWLMNLGEMIGLVGLVGSWITVLTGATIGGQREIIGLLEVLTKREEDLSKDHGEILRTLMSFTAKSKRKR